VLNGAAKKQLQIVQPQTAKKARNKKLHNRFKTTKGSLPPNRIIKIKQVLLLENHLLVN